MREITPMSGLLMLLVLAGASNAAYTEDTAFQTINEAEKIIRSMQDMNFGVTYANDTLNEAKALFAQERYIAAESVAKKVAEIKETVIRVSDLIDVAESRIYDLSLNGFNTTVARQIFDSALAEFSIDNYADSEKNINQLIATLDDMEASESIKKAGEVPMLDVLPAILDYMWLIIILFLLILVTGLRMKSAHTRRKHMTKMKRLEQETDTLKEEIKEAQKKYFEKGSIPKIDYEVILEKNSKRLDNIKNELLALRQKNR